MKFRTLPLAIVAVVAMTVSVDANNVVNVHGGGVLVRMTPRDGGNSPTANAVSDWVIKSNVRQVVLQWKTTPFAHVDHDEIRADTVIAARVAETLGPVRVSFTHGSDRTHLDSGDDEASVAVGLRGNGKVNVQLQVGVDDRHAVAGRHSATVTLTLTSH